MPNNQNLRPFNTLTPEEHRELSRRGGIASGERRREIAETKERAKALWAANALLDEAREEYRTALKRLVREERRKQRRRQMKKCRPARKQPSVVQREGGSQ